MSAKSRTCALQISQWAMHPPLTAPHPTTTTGLPALVQPRLSTSRLSATVCRGTGCLTMTSVGTQSTINRLRRTNIARMTWAKPSNRRWSGPSTPGMSVSLTSCSEPTAPQRPQPRFPHQPLRQVVTDTSTPPCSASLSRTRPQAATSRSTTGESPPAVTASPRATRVQTHFKSHQ